LNFIRIENKIGHFHLPEYAKIYGYMSN